MEAILGRCLPAKEISGNQDMELVGHSTQNLEVLS
jgi:hypothetical protein